MIIFGPCRKNWKILCEGNVNFFYFQVQAATGDPPAEHGDRGADSDEAVSNSRTRRIAGTSERSSQANDQEEKSGGQ